jgi:hypothetical protein
LFILKIIVMVNRTRHGHDHDQGGTSNPGHHIKDPAANNETTNRKEDTAHEENETGKHGHKQAKDAVKTKKTTHRRYWGGYPGL